MTSDGYSSLFAQGLLLTGSAYPSQQYDSRSSSAIGLLAPPVIIEPPPGSHSGQARHRRRRSSVGIEGSASPISLLRSPSRAAAQALSKLFKSPSRGRRTQDNDAAPRLVPIPQPSRVERPRLVFLPPRAKPAPTTPMPPVPTCVSPTPSTLSNTSFLSLERTPSPPPRETRREPLAPHNRPSPSYAATVIPHAHAQNLSAAELHNALVAPYRDPTPEFATADEWDRENRPSFDYANHPYRAESHARDCDSPNFLSMNDDDDDDELDVEMALNENVY
ncbi:hypothetical protein AURDEDRAFT_110011 [Auricularia subglabra TFB-10046 SS5]|nr:hypothetical protein AURDEDRAFT_110011 [Auricularia subglabra TFB-10046 SS5]